MPGFATVAAPLTSLTGSKVKEPIPWGEQETLAFNKLKQALTEAPVLAVTDPERPLVLMTDASRVGVGAVLTQRSSEDGRVRVVAYHSRKLTSTEQRYTVHERELLAVVDAAKVWRHYLCGRPFVLKTDNWANKHLQTQPHLDPKRQARWMEKLQE